MLVDNDDTVVDALLNANDAAACKFAEFDDDDDDDVVVVAVAVAIDELGAKFKAGE